MKITSIALIRGLVFQLIGTIFGMIITILVRLLMGLPAWHAEPVLVVGALFGIATFMYGTGALNDWLKWINGEETPEADVEYHGPGGWRRLASLSFDHKVIGVQYGITSLIVFLAAGLFAMVFRTELATPGIQFLVPDVFNTFISMHGIVMVGSMLLGVAAMSNYLVPLMIGTNDMAFPRLNAFAYWLNVPAVILLLSVVFLGGIDAGWTAYPPLSANLGKVGFAMFFVAVYFIGVSSILGALNIITSIVRLRTKGMNYFRMPIFVWTALSTALISLTATQMIGLSFQMVLFERLFGMGFFNPDLGGNVILFQHLFWFYSHPAVYVFVLPGLGVISELLPVFSRKPLFGYKWVALSALAIALVGFFVWAHHMFTSGMESYLRVPFMYSTLLVAVPTGIKFFSWIGTMWGGKLTFKTPMLFVLGAISVFLLGGLSGPPNGTVATDLFLHDTYWIVGHFHATMFGGFVFPFFAAIYYWFPKITGRMYNEKLGKLQFWLILPAFYMQSLGQMQIGLLGMRRRIVDYDPTLGITLQQTLITLAGFVIGLSVIVFVINMVVSVSKGEIADANPWRSRSLEFQLPSPIPDHNYKEPPEVIGEPYDYGKQDADYVNMNPTSQPAAAD